MGSAPASTGPAASKDRGGKTPHLRDRAAVIALHLEQLKPKVLDEFEKDDVSILPRPELAVRIGNIVSTETDADSHTLNLLDRRNLVADLINWLVHCSPKSPPKAAPRAGGASRTAAPRPCRTCPGAAAARHRQ